MNHNPLYTYRKHFTSVQTWSQILWLCLRERSYSVTTKQCLYLQFHSGPLSEGKGVREDNVYSFEAHSPSGEGYGVFSKEILVVCFLLLVY